jgi:hypothetical protein
MLQLVSRLPRCQASTYSTMSPSLVIQPEMKIPRKRQEIIHKLQTVVAPNIFSPRAIYDGRALMYAPKSLQLSAGGGGSVCLHIYAAHPHLNKIQQFLVSLTSKPPVVNTSGTFQVRITQTIGGIIKPES